jgi:hypothetical protein
LILKCHLCIEVSKYNFYIIIWAIWGGFFHCIIESVLTFQFFSSVDACAQIRLILLNIPLILRIHILWSIVVKSTTRCITFLFTTYPWDIPLVQVHPYLYLCGVDAQGDPCTWSFVIYLWYIHQRSLAITSRHLAAKQEKLGKKMFAQFCLQSIYFIPAGFFNMP